MPFWRRIHPGTHTEKGGLAMKKPRLLVIHLVVLSIGLLAASASAVEIDDPDRYTIKRSWTMRDLNLPGDLAGMVFDPNEDTLYVVGNADSPTSALFAFDVTRDPATHEITDLEDPELIFRVIP